MNLVITYHRDHYKMPELQINIFVDPAFYTDRDDIILGLWQIVFMYKPFTLSTVYNRLVKNIDYSERRI